MLLYSLIIKFELVTASIFRKFFNFSFLKQQPELHTPNAQLLKNAQNEKRINYNFSTESSLNFNTEWLLLAHKLYKVTDSILLTSLNAPNLHLNSVRNHSLIFYLHLLSSYNKFIAVILFLDLKKKFNLEEENTELLRDTESFYFLKTNTPKLYMPLTSLIYPNSLSNLNFVNKKTLSSILEQNLSLNKQNR